MLAPQNKSLTVFIPNGLIIYIKYFTAIIIYLINKVFLETEQLKIKKVF